MKDNNLEINEINPASPDFRTDLADKIADLAPEAVADGKIDFEKLKELLSDDVSNASERFGLFWPGKKNAIRQAQTPTTATLKPDFENSKDWDNTENVFIEGDNLEVLKILQNHYYGKIKMIYIDPPYNTGKDFVYKDNFRDGIKTYKEWTQQIDEDGKALSSNADTDGRYHSNWLNMMYPRLKLARNLLTQDGVMFISIDEHEAFNLKKLSDEIFGERNSIAQIAVYSNPRGRQSSEYIAASHEYVFVYAKNKSSAGIKGEPLSDSQTAEFSKIDEAGRRYREIGLRLRGGRATATESPTLHYPLFVDPETSEISTEQSHKNNRIEVLPFFSNGTAGTWRWSRKKVEAEKDALTARLVHGKDGIKRWDIFQKDYLTEEKRRKLKSLWLEKEINYDRAKDDFKHIGMDSTFDYAKPLYLLEKILSVATSPGDTVLDFFAGSGSFAHAVLQLNANDGGNRKHIQVQIPEPTPANSEARKSGYKTITEISQERLRRAGEKIKLESTGKLAHGDHPLDIGFRAYKLSDTNFVKWNFSSTMTEDELKQGLFELEDSSNDHARTANLFTELLLKQGLSLTERISQTEIAGLKLHAIIDHNEDFAMLAYLDEHTPPSLSQLREIIESKPTRFVMLEDGFAGSDELKTNLVQTCKTNNVELWTA